MMKHDTTPVQLYTCHGEDNQHFEIIKGQFRSFRMEGFCITAEKKEKNAEVHLEKCVDDKEEQQWDFTGNGYVKLTGHDDLCLDVEAGLKEDGTRQNWTEIKKEKAVNVHLYTCHDPKTTKRVNQLWSWRPYHNGKPVNEMTEEIKKEKAVNVHLYTCHDPKTT